MVSKANIEAQIKALKNKLEVEWSAIDELYTKINSKNDEVTELKNRRDGLNQLVKTLISEGKQKQKERDMVRDTTHPKRELIKNLRLNIREFSHRITELKDIRDGKHREAKGSKNGLTDNIAASLTTLLKLDLALKDEITLFNMIFSTKQRYSAKVQAEDTHKQIEEIYNALKESERQIQEQEMQITKIIQESQIMHNESINKFKEKDELRNRSNTIHSQVVEGYKEIKNLRGNVDLRQKNISELKAELNVLHKKLRASDRKRQEMHRKEKLESAKEKLKDKKKMGLDELRLLMESGSLKDDE